MDSTKFFMEPTPSQIKTIKELLNQNDDRFERNIEVLTEWMDKHSFIPKEYEKSMLPLFHRACKLDIQKTKKRLEMYFIWKSKCPKYMRVYHFDDEELKILNNVYLIPQEKLTPEGYRVTFTGILEANPDAFDMKVFMKLIWMLSLHAFNKGAIDGGLMLVVDAKICSLQIIAKIFSLPIPQLTKFIQSMFPYRTQKIIFANVPSYLEKFIHIWRVCVPAKIQKRIVLDTGTEQIKKCISDDCIPSDFGGTAKCVKERIQDCILLFQHYETWYQKHDEVQVDLDKVPKDIISEVNLEDNFGVHGTFRQLNVD